MNIKSTFTPTTVLSPRDGWELVNQDGQNWHFDSLYFASPLKDILDFPFFNNSNTFNKPMSTAQIMLPVNATKHDQQNAKYLQEYFAFWGKQGMNPAQDIKIPIVPFSPILTMDAKIIIGSSITKRKENTLYIGNVTQLLNALDQKYFYSGAMNPGPSGADVLKKANLPDNILIPNP